MADCGARPGSWNTSARLPALAASSPWCRHCRLPPRLKMSPADLARLLALAALWGGSFAFIRVAAPVVGPLWLAESRVALAFVVLLLLALSRGKVPALRERWRDFVVIGVVNSALPFALFCFAGQYIAASTSASSTRTVRFGALAAALWIRTRSAGASRIASGSRVWCAGAGDRTVNVARSRRSSHALPPHLCTACKRYARCA